MKKVLIVFSLLLASPIYAQLNPAAKSFKEAKYEALKDGGAFVYDCIKEFSVKKWDGDHAMILHETNQQSNAALEFLQFIKNKGTDLLLLMRCVDKWSDKPADVVFHPSINWSMVVHEYKQQIEAKKSY